MRKHIYWHPGTIDKMLSNEKFCGDACMQKTYTIDFLTKKKVKNQGYAPQYYIEDNHEAIIPKELFHQVQVEKARRASLNKAAVTRKANKAKKEKSKYSSKYVLTELLTCGECGTHTEDRHGPNTVKSQRYGAVRTDLNKGQAPNVITRQP